jgi:hypothetical protein
MKHFLRRAVLALALIAGFSPAMFSPAIAQQFPLTMPQNTVYGRLGIGTGPGQAIPFLTLKSQLGVPTLPDVYASAYNVKCDGTVDESANIQRAVAAADALGGATVALPPGRCVVANTVFLNKWVGPGILQTPGMRIRGAGKDVTQIDTHVASGYPFAVNPDWNTIFKALSLASAGNSGVLAANTYYVQITANDGLGNEVFVTLANPTTTSGANGSISIPVGRLNTGYTINAYIGTTSSPTNYAIVNGTNASAVAGNQTITITGIGSARTPPATKIATNQIARISDLSIINNAATSAASGVLFFKAAYAGLDNVYMKNLTGNGLDIPNYTGDADGSLNVSVTNSKFDTIAGTCVNAAGTHLELSNFYISDTIFNLCGTLPANYVQPANYATGGFTITAITNANPGVVTTSVSHTLAANDEIYIQGLAGGTFSTLNSAKYRVCPTATVVVTATTFGLCNQAGGTLDTSALGAYTASSGTEALAWRPPTATANNSGALVWMGLIGTFRNLDFTQNKNFSMYFTEAGASDNATIENVDFENTYGKGLYAASLGNGTFTNSECLSTNASGPTISCVQLGTGFAAGGVYNFQIKNIKVRSDVTPTVGFEQFQNLNNGATFADTNRVTGITWQPVYDAAGQTRFNGFTFDPIPGQGIFSVSALNTVKLAPSGTGACMPMHLKATGEWVCYKLPTAGLSSVVGPTTPSTTFFFYLYNTAANTAPYAGAIEISLGGPVLDAAGYLVKSGDSTRTYIGTATTNGAGAFVTTATQFSQYGGITSVTAPLVLNNGNLSSPSGAVISGTGHGDSNYSILPADSYVYTNAAFTALRTWTLPAANSVIAGTPIRVEDAQNTITTSNALVVSRAGADTINTTGTSVAFTGAGAGATFISDGVSNWGTPVQNVSIGGTGRASLTNHSLQVGALTNPVTQLAVGTNGQFLAGATGADPAFVTMSQDCTVTAAGVMTCTKTNNVSFGNYATLSAGQLTASLGADVNLNAVGTYFDGPSVAQGTTGTWFASGTVTVTATANDNIFCKLYDGTTVIASAEVTPVTTAPQSISLSGALTSPAGNIRIACKDITNTTGKMVFNATSNSKDSTVTAFRIN